MTTSRLRYTGVVEEVETCPFCKEGEDSMHHMLDCDTVRSALTTVAADAGADAPDWNMRDLFLQRYTTGDNRALMIACLTTVWSARHLVRKGFQLSAQRLAEVVGRELRCPWLVACSRNLCKKKRRRARARAREIIWAAAYLRYDSASSSQGARGYGDAG